MQAGAVIPILHDQMTVRRVRVACGLVMFTYLALHLCMHAIGNVSFDAMQWATRIHDAVWRNPVGTVALYGAFAIHFSLALYALYARRSFRMGAGELLRLVLGFSIVPLLAHHFAAGRYVWSAFDVARRYDVVLPVYFAFVPFWGWQQVTALLVAWSHGCLGIHLWLRQRPGYGRYAPLLLTLAVLLPVVSLLGVFQGTREILARQSTAKAVAQEGYGYDDGYGDSKSGAADVDGKSRALEYRIYWTYFLLVAGVFAARGVRWAVERQRGLVSITYPGGRLVRVPIGFPVLEASRAARIPHASICGGRGRCTTCRVRVLRGFEDLPEAHHAEAAALARLRAPPNVRLACQLRPRADLSVLPLLPPDVGADDPRRNRDSMSAERFVAIMFVDIRRSTALFEKRLPYDVVFLLNHYFDAVCHAMTAAGGAPNQFIGDGVMAIFGMHTGPREACAQALDAARLMQQRLAEMNRALAHELASPMVVGMGVHAGHAILGEVGYGDRFLLTAIGDTVHVAARLQDLTKEYSAELVVSQIVADTAGVDLSAFAAHEVRVRGREEPVAVRVVGALSQLAAQPA